MATIIKPKITREEMREIKANTMACWWPSKINGQFPPNWEGIAGELEGLVQGEVFYFSERGSDFNRLHNLQKLTTLAKDKARYQTDYDAAYADYFRKAMHQQII